MIKKFLKRVWKPLVWLLVLAAAAAALWLGGIKPLIAKLKGDVIAPEDIVTAKQGTVEVMLKSQGTVMAKQDIKVTSKPSGILQAVYVKEGDQVKKGQKLGLIKPGRNEFEDFKPVPIYAPAAGTVVKCHADSRDYDKDLSERDLSLPRPGTFLEGSYDNTENATCFLRLVNTDTLVIPLYVSETQVLMLKKGMPAEVEVLSLGKKAQPMQGKITHISTQIEKTGDRWSDNKGFLVLVELPRNGQNILLGVNTNVTVVLQKKENTLTIPANALFEKAGKSYVFKYRGKNKADKTEVTTGLASDTTVEITSGLQENEQILIDLPYGESW